MARQEYYRVHVRPVCAPRVPAAPAFVPYTVSVTLEMQSPGALSGPGNQDRLQSIRTFLVDLDGVVYTGNTAIPGAAEFFRFLNATGRSFQCITNNSTLTAAQYVKKLAGMDIPVAEKQVLTSPQATAVYLKERFGAGARVYPIGEEGLIRALLNEGFRLVDERPDVVVCGLDRRLTYDRLMRACFAIRDGAPLVATNPDLSLPTERGFLPGNGATIAYLQAATGVTPSVVGKPEATMLEVAMNLLGASAEETAIIGDGLITDMLAGQRAGVTKILVLTGVGKRDDLPNAPAKPDFVFDNLPALQAHLR
jgi:4-nitrophenyl phosphatase